MPDLFDITHGVGGLWESHEWTSPGGLMVELNEEDIAYGVFVSRTEGLHSLAEAELPVSQLPGRIGERPLPADTGGKTLTYVGEIRGDTVPRLRLVRTALVSAFADRRSEGVMNVSPHPDSGGPAARFYARAIALDPPEEQSGRHFKRDYQLGLRLTDPRFYFPELAVTDTDSTSVTVTNAGSAPADPVITVTVATPGTVEVTDGTHVLQFLNVPAGELVLNFRESTARVDDANVDMAVLTSDWWDAFVYGIAPGATVTIGQTGGTDITVEFTPSIWA